MQVRQVAPRRFPSGDRRAIAIIGLEPEALAERYDLAFEQGVDDLDYFSAAAIELSSGAQLLLLRYLRLPEPGTEVMADAHADPVACRRELLRELGLTEADLTWWPEAS